MAGIEIRSWYTGGLLFAVEVGSLKLAVEFAVSQDANLRGANLRGADLRGANLGGADLGGANLGGAKNAETVRLDTGETLREYIDNVLPALLTAGGKTIEAAVAAWEYHIWKNCP
ncbi:MAG: pentapeptide repeat-containing protein, partial [candidate division NC10 bacterium]|nr:pentapeptide repeat-containing protein [candidate division NC10 bacterium]